MGSIEVVRHAATTADIQKQAGGVSEVFNQKTLADWLRSHNPSELEYKTAVDNFMKSLAASCVSTYVLGIGDRHNDSILKFYSSWLLERYHDKKKWSSFSH